MRCDCCNKKRGLLESYVQKSIEDEKINLCSECIKCAYRVREAYSKQNKEQIEMEIAAWNKRTKKATEPFKKWKKSFIETTENESREAKKE
jgi:hypothetical protein